MSHTRTPNKFTDIKPKYVIPYKPHPKTGNPRLVLEGEVKEAFCRLYPKHTMVEMMKLFGVSFATINRLAKKLGLKKDMKAIRRKWVKAVKKTCEENGYYASLRGRPLSEKARAAYKRKVAEEGYHPIKHLKATNPRRFKKMCQKRSETRRELVRRERLRMDYGLPRLTSINLVADPISRRASEQKSRMIKAHNYFADPVHRDYICYDSLTDRSPRMEATAIRKGLRVVEAEDEEPEQTNLDSNEANE